MRRTFATIAANRPLEISQYRISNLEKRSHGSLDIPGMKKLLRTMDIPRITVTTFEGAEGNDTIQRVHDLLMKEGKVILWLQSSKGKIGHEVALLLSPDNTIEYFDSEGDNAIHDPSITPDLPDINPLLSALHEMTGEDITIPTQHLQGRNLALGSPYPSTCFPHCIVRLINSDLTRDQFYDEILKLSGGSFDAYALDLLETLSNEKYLIEEGKATEIPELGVPLTYEELRKAGYDDDYIPKLREREAYHELGRGDPIKYLEQMEHEDNLGRKEYIKHLATKRALLSENPNVTDYTKEEAEDEFYAEYLGSDIPAEPKYETFDIVPRRMNIRAVLDFEQRQEEKQIESDIKKLVQELEVGTEEQYDRQYRGQILLDAIASGNVTLRRHRPPLQLPSGGSEADLF